MPSQDLYKPESARFRAHLSGVINFAKFREEKLVPYSELQEASEGLNEQRAHLEAENAALVRLQCVQDSHVEGLGLPLVKGEGPP